MTPVITGLDHVQLAAPPGSEEILRAFYSGVLGMSEVPKPPLLAAGPVQLHIGVEEDFRPARKAHPGLRVSGIEAFAERLESRGTAVVWDGDLPGHRRFHTADPFGNRLEFLEPAGAS